MGRAERMGNITGHETRERPLHWRQRRWTRAARLSVFALLACGKEETSTAIDPRLAEPAMDSRFQKVTLNGAPGEPIGLAVLPDGRVLHSTREGRLFQHDRLTQLPASTE